MTADVIRVSDGLFLPMIGLDLIALRAKKGITQSELSERSGVAQREISRFESGRALHRLPLHAEALAAELGPEVRGLADRATRSLEVFEPQERLLQARVDVAVIRIVGRLLAARTEPEKIIAAVTVKEVCSEMIEAEPRSAQEDVAVRMAIRRSLGRLRTLFKPLFAGEKPESD